LIAKTPINHSSRTINNINNSYKKCDIDLAEIVNDEYSTNFSSPSSSWNRAECIVTNPQINLQEDNDEIICDCLKNKQHFDNVVLDTKFKGSVEKIYNLLYTSGFIAEFLTNLENNDGVYNNILKGKYI